MGVKVREKDKDSGVYWVFINYKGKRTSRQVGSLKAATKVKENIEARLKLGQDALPKEDKPAPTVAEYYDRFKAIYLATAVREGTKSRYETSFKHHVIPFLGNVHLNHLTRERVRDFVANLVQKKISVVVKETNRDESGKAVITKKTIERSLSRPTIRIIVAQFCAMLSHAVEEKVIAVNPAVKLGKFYKQAKVLHEEIQPLTRDEVPVFLQAVLERSKDYYPIFLAAIHTGMRAGELIGLRWSDIDFNGKFIVIRRCFTRGRIELTKTGKQRRIDMSDTLIEALSAHRKRLKEDWLKEGKNEIPEWVFPNQEGNPLE